MQQSLSRGISPRRILGGLFLLARLAFYSLIGLRVYQISHWHVKGFTAADKQGLSEFLIGVAVGIEVIVQIARMSLKRAARKREEVAKTAAMEQQHAIEVQKAWETDEMPIVSAGSLILQPGERCVLNENARVYAPVTQTQRQGGFGGFSVPIGHTGIRARVGQFASHPVTTTQLALVNQGPLCLTNYRLVVLGELQMSQLPLKDILTLDVHTDGVRIGMANGKPITIQTGSARLGIYIRRLLDAPHA